jgi:hypothetical protein
VVPHCPQRRGVELPGTIFLVASAAANRKLVDVASAVVDGHRLLPAKPGAAR